MKFFNFTEDLYGSGFSLCLSTQKMVSAIIRVEPNRKYVLVALDVEKIVKQG